MCRNLPYRVDKFFPWTLAACGVIAQNRMPCMNVWNRQTLVHRGEMAQEQSAGCQSLNSCVYWRLNHETILVPPQEIPALKAIAKA